MPMSSPEPWSIPGRMRWVLSRTNDDYIRYLSEKASVSPTLSQILINRCVKTPEEVRDFLNPSPSNMHDPFLLPGMDTAAARIRRAVESREGILVFGDYDADGLSATAIMLETLRMMGAVKTGYLIPNRLTDGYGLNRTAIDHAAAKGYRLVITVDCGITATREALYASRLGVDLIITDHHHQTGELPEALAVVNPARDDSIYPFRELAGAGVAFKLAQALLPPQQSSQLIDLAALGTVADVVPLLGENRIIARSGLDLMQFGGRPGIQALLLRSGHGSSQITSSSLSFMIAPRINAAGRLGDASPVVDLLTTRDGEKAGVIADFLDENNRQRQAINTQILNSARERMFAEDDSGVVVLADEDWHPGVLGIVAARLSDELNRPVFLLSVRNGMARGSGRSIPPFNMIKALTRCDRLLEAYGGHHQAAGLTMKTASMGAFRESMSEQFREAIGPDGYIPHLRVDAEVELSDLGLSLMSEIEQLQPFGSGNEEPVLGCRGTETVGARVVGKNHLKLGLRKGPHLLDTIWFGMGGELERAGSGMVDAVFSPRLNEYQGARKVQLHLKALRKSRA